MMWIVSRVVQRAATAALIALFIAASVHPLASADYEELVAQAKRSQGDVDYAALRIAYADSKLYDGYNTDIVSLRGPFQKAYTDGDCPGAIRQGEAILEKNYVFIDAHFVLSVCHRRLGETAQSEQHLAAARALMKAILASGDGKTPETAYVVISVAEEYSLLGMQGSRKLQQALISKNGHSYDLMTVETKSGAKEQVYFNIDRVMRWSAERFKPQK